MDGYERLIREKEIGRSNNEHGAKKLKTRKGKKKEKKKRRRKQKKVHALIATAH